MEDKFKIIPRSNWDDPGLRKFITDYLNEYYKERDRMLKEMDTIARLNEVTLFTQPKEETKMAKSTWQYEYSTKNHHRYVNADGDNIYIPRFVSATYPTAEITIFTSIKSAKRSGTVKAVVKNNDPVVGYEE